MIWDHYGSPLLFWELDTFESIESRPGRFAEVLQSWWDRLLAPTMERLGSNAHANLGVFFRDGSRPTDLRLDNDSFEQALAAVRRGSATVSMSVERTDDRGFILHSDKYEGMHVRMDDETESADAAVTRMTYSVSSTLARRFEDVFSQDRIVDSFIRAGQALRAVTGYLTVDYVSDPESPYEKWSGRSFRQGLASCDEILRGYYWGNLLSEQHLKRIGGLEALNGERGSIRVTDLTSDDHQLVYVQLNQPLYDFDDAGLVGLAKVLAPALPPPPTRRFYFGPPLRLPAHNDEPK
jgi:hypothetical protein